MSFTSVHVRLALAPLWEHRYDRAENNREVDAFRQKFTLGKTILKHCALCTTCRDTCQRQGVEK